MRNECESQAVGMRCYHRISLYWFHLRAIGHPLCSKSPTSTCCDELSLALKNPTWKYNLKQYKNSAVEQQYSTRTSCGKILCPIPTQMRAGHNSESSKEFGTMRIIWEGEHENRLRLATNVVSSSRRNVSTLTANPTMDRRHRKEKPHYGV